MLPLTGSLITIDSSTGDLGWSAGTSLSPFHGRLASNKQLIVGTTSPYSGPYPPNGAQIYIMQKRVPNLTYSASDITNKSLVVSQIESGDSHSNWMYARGSTDASAVVSMPVITLSTGAVPGGANLGVLMINQVSGLITLSTNTWFQGMMSPDKTYIVSTETDTMHVNNHRLMVIQIRNTAPIFSQADIAGTFVYHGITTHLGWTYAPQVIGQTGNVTVTSFVSNFQTSLSKTSTRILSPDRKSVV
jgi:hypothetical protein